MVLLKIVSGGQTGVDRAALDAAISLNLPHGGYCPRGRLAEDGPIDTKYQLYECESKDYIQRTELNVIDSDGTLIINPGKKLKGGTNSTFLLCKKHKKPHMILDLNALMFNELFFKWLDENKIRKLNVAGPRESAFSGIYNKSLSLLMTLLGKV